MPDLLPSQLQKIVNRIGIKLANFEVFTNSGEIHNIAVARNGEPRKGHSIILKEIVKEEVRRVLIARLRDENMDCYSSGVSPAAFNYEGYRASFTLVGFRPESFAPHTPSAKEAVKEFARDMAHLEIGVEAARVLQKRIAVAVHEAFNEVVPDHNINPPDH